MKKSFLVLPIAIAVLSACSSDSPAPVENASGSFSPGMMQPVDNNFSTGGSWEPQIQQTLPTGIGTPPPTPRNTYQPVQPVQPVNNYVAPVKTQVSQNFEIPRNPQTNAPDYSRIDKGFYKGDSYTVRKGDTMFLIAYISGMDVKELASLNNMSEPYKLSVGQTLKLNPSMSQPTMSQPTMPQSGMSQPVMSQPAVTYTPGPNGTQYGSDGSITGPIKSGTGVAAAAIPVNNAMPINTAQTQPINHNPAPAVSNIAWRWPASGNVVQGFSSADGGNKGIDISGSRGQAVNAAAAGRVVYAGNALRGYGNLIIIKHNDDFLSAYAHNETILVKDQQQVNAGQQIAKMGSSGTNGVKLHFEIRHKGKSVDPMRYLPRR